MILKVRERINERNNIFCQEIRTQIRTHVSGTPSAVQTDAERLKVLQTVIKGFNGLTRQVTTHFIDDCSGELDAQSK